MSVFDSIQNLVGAPYNRLTYNKDIIDTYLLREARSRGIHLPTGSAPDREKYYGAHVETTRAGISPHVVYVDVSSMYPNLFVGLNASPETIIGTYDDLQSSEYTEDDCVWGYIDTRPVKRLEKGEDYNQYTTGRYKMVYDPHGNSGSGEMKWRDDPQYERCFFLSHGEQLGFIPDTVDDLLDLKNQYRGTPKYGAVKKITNSVYGVTGTASKKRQSSFRLYDWRIAESVTLAGRKMIQWTRDAVLEYVEERGFEDAYAAIGDTDSVGLALPSAATRHEVLDVVEDVVEWINGDGYDQFMQETFNVPPNRHRAGLDVESYAPRLFVPATDPWGDSDVGVKKRYGQWVTVEDGEETDSIDITGLEHERSDVAPITKDAQFDFFEAVLRNGPVIAKETVFSDLREYAQTVRDGAYDVSYVAKASGMSKHPRNYGSPNRTPQPIYRGAKYADMFIDGVTIQAGDTVQLVYVTDTGQLPARYSGDTAEDGDVVDAIALPNVADLPNDVTVDWERHFQKTLKEPMQPLLNTLHWKWDEILSNTEQQSLDSF